MPFISVVIPLYNKENYIKDTIESVLDQSFTDYELLIIDDCSTDNSKRVASQFADSRISIVTHSTNKGLSASRNTGIQNAAADYIAFLDADDLWKPNFLSEIHQLITDFPEASLFATNYEEIIITNMIIPPANSTQNFTKQQLVSDYFMNSLQQPLYCHSSVCFKKDVFENIGFYDETITYGEDVDFNIRANLEYSLAYSTHPFTQYLTDSENQITQSNLSSKKITDFDYYEKNNPSNASLKKFLDFQRYTKAKMYKMEGNSAKYHQLKKGISLSNLNWKQIILLYLPSFWLHQIKSWKLNKLKKGKRFTSYN
jgi:glycosyltransferase involved in cell wall biosynthesis